MASFGMQYISESPYITLDKQRMIPDTQKLKVSITDACRSADCRIRSVLAPIRRSLKLQASI